MDGKNHLEWECHWYLASGTWMNLVVISAQEYIYKASFVICSHF